MMGEDRYLEVKQRSTKLSLLDEHVRMGVRAGVCSPAKALGEKIPSCSPKLRNTRFSAAL